MEEKEMVVKEEKSLMEDMKINKYYPIECKTIEDKKRLYNALEECDILLNGLYEIIRKMNLSENEVFEKLVKIIKIRRYEK